MNFIGIALAVIFAILAGILLSGKGEKILSVYNLMPQAKKDKINKKDLCKFNGKVFLAMSLSSMLLTLGNITEYLGLAFLGISIIVILAIGSTIYVLLTSRFDRK